MYKFYLLIDRAFTTCKYLALRTNGAAKWSTDLMSRFLMPQFKWDLMNGWCSPTRGKWQAGLIRNRLAPKRNSGNESRLAKQGILPGPWEVVGLNLTELTFRGFILTALRHHALLCLRQLRSTGRAIRGFHLHHALSPPHTHPTAHAAGLPLTPLGHHTAAGC